MSERELRIPISFNNFSFVIVDDGNGEYDAISGSDHLEDASGTMISEKDPRVQGFLKGMGIEKLHGTRVKPLGDFIVLWQTKKDELQKASDEETVWSAYQELHQQASMAGVDMGLDSAFFKEFSKIAGGYSCFVFLRIAEEHANKGWVNNVNENLGLAQKCVDDLNFVEGSFAPRTTSAKKLAYEVAIKDNLEIAQSYAAKGWTNDMNTYLETARTLEKEGGLKGQFEKQIQGIHYTGYKKSVSDILADANGYAKKGWTKDMNNYLESAEKVATEGGILGEFKVKLAETKKAGYTKAVNDILADANGYAKKGWTKDMNNYLESAEKVATEGGILGDFETKLAETKKAGYTKAVNDILADANGYAKKGWTKDMDERLASAEKVAKEGSVYDSFKKQIGEIRRSGYRVATKDHLVEAQNYASHGYISDTEEALTNAAGLAKKGDILDEFSAQISNIRKSVYLKVAIDELGTAKRNAGYKYFSDAREGVSGAKETAQKGGVDSDPEFVKLLKEVEAMIPKE